MTDEEYVRSRWEQVSVTDWYAGQPCSVEAWSVQLYRWTSRIGNTATDAKMWANALEFTRECERKIAELKWEISLQKLLLSNADALPQEERNPHDHDADRDAIARTVGRLEEIMTNLQLGMKTLAFPTAPQPKGAEGDETRIRMDEHGK